MLNRVDQNLQKMAKMYKGIRNRSAICVMGLPLYDIAMGPDFEKGEMRGHARGIIAIGDLATGVIAIGGLARGLIAFGGLAIGGLAIGGGAVGIAVIGGGALGLISIGGGAVGYYAFGGAAFGKHVVSGMVQDPEALEFFKSFLPSRMFPIRQ